MEKNTIVEDMNFIKDHSGRIIKVVRGDCHADIIWKNSNVDIDFCNFVITIVITARGVGKDV